MRNIERQKVKQHESYLRNKAKIISRNQQRRKERRKWFDEEIMQGLKCIHCNEDEKVCLDFHHLNSKTKDQNVSKLLNGLRSLERIKEEVKKCIVVCSNCHRKIHAGLL